MLTALDLVVIVQGAPPPSAKTFNSLFLSLKSPAWIRFNMAWQEYWRADEYSFIPKIIFFWEPHALFTGIFRWPPIYWMNVKDSARQFWDIHLSSYDRIRIPEILQSYMRREYLGPGWKSNAEEPTVHRECGSSRPIRSKLTRCGEGPQFYRANHDTLCAVLNRLAAEIPQREKHSERKIQGRPTVQTFSED